MIYTAHTHQRILESNSASRTWNSCRPALKQLQLLYTAGANIACKLTVAPAVEITLPKESLGYCCELQDELGDSSVDSDE